MRKVIYIVLAIMIISVLSVMDWKEILGLIMFIATITFLVLRK